MALGFDFLALCDAYRHVSEMLLSKLSNMCILNGHRHLQKMLSVRFSKKGIFDIIFWACGTLSMTTALIHFALIHLKSMQNKGELWFKIPSY